MLSDDDEKKRIIRYEAFLKDLIRHLSSNGVILVLQPTKGGSFEKLLSLIEYLV